MGTLSNQAVFVLLLIVIISTVQGALMVGVALHKETAAPTGSTKDSDGRITLGLMAFVFLVLIIAIIAQAAFITALATNQQVDPGPAPKADSATLGQEIIKQAMGGIFTLSGAGLGASGSIFNFQMGTRKEYKDRFFSAC